MQRSVSSSSRGKSGADPKNGVLSLTKKAFVSVILLKKGKFCSACRKRKKGTKKSVAVLGASEGGKAPRSDGQPFGQGEKAQDRDGKTGFFFTSGKREGLLFRMKGAKPPKKEKSRI